MTTTRGRKPAAVRRRMAVRPQASASASPLPFVNDHDAAEVLYYLRRAHLHAVDAATVSKLPTAIRRAIASRGFDPVLLWDLDAATVSKVWNEILFDGKPNTNDPIKWRLGAFRSDQTGYIGCICGDILEGGKRLEKIIIALKLDSSAESRARGESPIPMVEIFCHVDGGSSTSDADMRRVVSFSAHEVLFSVPVRYLQGVIGGPPPVTLPPPVTQPPPVVQPPPVGAFTYKPVVKGILYAFPQGSWAAIALVFPFPVDAEVVTAYAAAPSPTLWVATVDRMFERRDNIK